MTFQEVANELVAGCRENRTRENLDRLYAADAVSVEPMDMGQGRETKGIAGIHGKHDWWEASFDVPEMSVEGPFLHGQESFAVVFDLHTVNKATGDRRHDREIGLYHVKDGKIFREEFFYAG